ncbi:MAG: ABC transporter permease [Acidimicrobiales bacterium]|nr:ABC transporter permease [Acidimicrobiales bacterium]
MFLALKELQRAKVRFGLLIAAVALLVFLILFQQSLQNGLLTSFVGAIRNQSAEVLVYRTDGRRILQGSVISPDLEAMVRSSGAAAEVARIGQGTFTVTPGEGGDGVPIETSILGYEDPGLGAPTTLVEGRLPEGPGEAVASDADAELGFGVGDTVTVLPGGLDITVVGLARDVQLNVTPTLFVTYDTYVQSVRSRNPDAGEPLPNVLALRAPPDVPADRLVDQVNGLSDELDTLTRADAADKAPGVAQVRQSFQVIFLLYGFVVPLVTGLFFLIITFQKASALTLLRAIGAPARTLLTSLLVQVVVVLGGGLLLGIGLYAALVRGRIGGIPLRFETTAVLVWTALLVAGGLLSSLFSARRVMALDPYAATTGAGVGS